MSQDYRNKHSRFKHKNDQETALYKPILSEQSSSKCFVLVLGAFVVLCAVLLVFASIARLRNPEVELISATLTQIRYSAPPSSASFNATMTTHLRIKNPNYGGVFSYENSTVSVGYDGVRFGDRNISSGTVNARETKVMNVTMNLRSGNYVTVAEENLSSDINSGTLNLTSYVKLSGTVQLLNIINKKKVIEMACVMNLNLSSHAVQGIQC